jgi:hypothetical protein
MSLLEQVFREYGIPEMPNARTDKTAERASVSSVSGWLDELETINRDPAVSRMIQITRMRYEGKMPEHYTSTTNCRHCGPVPIWEGCPPEVLDCPWCFNRLKGLPIPRRQANDPANNR